MKPTPKCAICGHPCQPCQPYERNTDGTHTHDHCLKQHAQRPSQPIAK